MTRPRTLPPVERNGKVEVGADGEPTTAAEEKDRRKWLVRLFGFDIVISLIFCYPVRVAVTATRRPVLTPVRAEQ